MSNKETALDITFCKEMMMLFFIVYSLFLILVYELGGSSRTFVCYFLYKKREKIHTNNKKSEGSWQLSVTNVR